MELIAALWLLTLWVQIPMAILVVAIVYGIFEEDGKLTSIAATLLIAAGILAIDGTFTAILMNPGILFTILVGYVFLGNIWALFRWIRFLLKRRAAGATSAPLASEHKDKLSFWTLTWPLDIIFYFFGTFLSDLFGWFYGLFGGGFQRISNYIFKDVKQVNNRGQREN